MTEMDWIDRRARLRFRKIEDAKDACRRRRERKYENQPASGGSETRRQSPKKGAVARPSGEVGVVPPNGVWEARGGDLAQGDGDGL